MALGVALNWLANWAVAFTFPLMNAVRDARLSLSLTRDASMARC